MRSMSLLTSSLIRMDLLFPGRVAEKIGRFDMTIRSTFLAERRAQPVRVAEAGFATAVQTPVAGASLLQFPANYFPYLW